MPHIPPTQALIKIEDDIAAGCSGEPDAGLAFCFQLTGGPASIPVEPPAVHEEYQAFCLCNTNHKAIACVALTSPLPMLRILHRQATPVWQLYSNLCCEWADRMTYDAKPKQLQAVAVRRANQRLEA